MLLIGHDHSTGEDREIGGSSHSFNNTEPTCLVPHVGCVLTERRMQNGTFETIAYFRYDMGIAKSFFLLFIRLLCVCLAMTTPQVKTGR